MQIVDSLQLLPGECFFCSAAVTPAIDTGRDINSDDYGNYHHRIYICPTCVGEMADLIGWISPDKAESIKARARYADNAAKKHKAALDAQRQFVMDAFAEAEAEPEVSV